MMNRRYFSISSETEKIPFSSHDTHTEKRKCLHSPTLAGREEFLDVKNNQMTLLSLHNKVEFDP